MIEGVISPDQNFSTQLVSGAIDKRPKDYELVYDNKYFTSVNTIEDSGKRLVYGNLFQMTVFLLLDMYLTEVSKNQH